MNKVYKIIWSNARKCYVVVSEIAKNHGKNNTKSIVGQLAARMRLAAREMAGAVRRNFIKGSLSAVCPCAAARWIVPLMTVGILLQAAPGFASTITDKNGNSVINPGDRVHEIYAQRQIVNDKVSLSVNQFQQYNVTAGDVANMYFRMTKDGADAANLLNLVKERINIGGTVNAIKGNRIDGNLYFISPNGLAVTNTGVINAGRLAVLVPDDSISSTNPRGYFSGVLWNGDSDLASYFLSDLSQYGKRDDKGNFVKLSDRWAINNDNKASIDIAGQINARSGIVLGASKIAIQNGALLQSRKDLDFGNLVNAKNADGTVATVANLNNVGMTMAAATDKSGDIILRAEANNEYANNPLVPLGQTYDVFFNSANTASAEVAGTVKGDAGVDVSANARTTFDNTTWTGIKPSDVAKELANDLGINVDADWVIKYNTASVALKQGGSIEAGGRAALQSDAGLSVKLKTATLGKKLDDTSAAIPVAAVDVAKIKNKALVDVQGTLVSGDDMSLAAAADTSANLASVASVPGQENENDKGNSIYLGTAWITGDSVADVTLGPSGTVTAGGDFSADAKATSSMAASTSVVGRDKTFVSTSIAVIDYDSAANVNLRRSVTADSVKVNAENNVSGLDLSTDDSNGWGENVYVQYKVAGDTNANVLAKKIKDKFGWTAILNGGGLSGLENLFTKTQEYITAGASVGILDSSNTANITVAPGVELKAVGEAVKKDKDGNIVKDKNGNPVAGGFVSLTANTLVESLHHSVAGEANKQDEDTASKLTVAAAVLYSRLDNDATIELQSDPKTHKGVTLTSEKGDVALNAGAKQVYDPLEPMKGVVERLEKLLKTLKAMGKEFPELTNLHAEAVRLYEKREDGSIDESTAGASLADFGYSLGGFLSREAKNLIALDQGVQGLIQDLSNAVSPASYTNYYVRSYTVDSQDSGSNLDLAASVNLARLHNKGIVSLGENASVTAGRNISIDATTDTNVVSFTGNGGEYLALSESNGNGVGASVAVQDFTGDSMILSGKGVTLKAERGAAGEDSGNIFLHTDNSMIQTGVILSAGKADSHLGASGSVNVLAGGSNSLVLMDDESVVKAANAVSLAADNITTVSNIAGGLALGSSRTNLALGAGVAWNALDINSIAAIADNGTDAAVDTIDTDTDDFKNKTVDEQNAIKAANTVARARKLAAERAAVKTMDTSFALSEKKLSASLGTKTTDGAVRGSVTGRNITATANSAGTVNAVALEGVSNSENHSGFDTFTKWGSIGASVKNQTTEAAKAYVKSPLTALQKWFGDPEVKTKWDFSGYQPINGNNAPSTAAYNAAAAGSVAINKNAGETAAVMESVQLNLRKQAGSESAGTLHNAASDDLFTGAWSGASALNWFTGGTGAPANDGAMKGALGTALSFNFLNHNVNALILSSDISQAGAIRNMAVKNGAEVAASLGLAVTNDSQGTAADAAVAFGMALNRNKSDVHALLKNSNSSYEKNKDGISYSDGTDISISVYDGDVQVAGGADLSWVKNDGRGISAGVTAALSEIQNDMQSGISGGSYTGLSSLEVAGEDALTQVNAAVSLGLSRSDKGFASAGSLGYAELKNTNRGFISGTEKIEAAGSVSVTNQDISATDADGKSKNRYVTYLQNRNVDADGTGYLSPDTRKKLNVASGSTIVNVAVEVSEGKSVSAGAAVAVGNVTNSFNSDITDNKIIAADKIEGTANVRANIVSVAAGASVSEKTFGGMASLAVNDLKQDNIVSVTGNRDDAAGSGIVANTVTAAVKNTARVVAATGDFAGGTNAVGLAVAYNLMNDTTGIYSSKNRIGAKERARGTAVSLDAQNDAYALALSLGAAASYKDDGKVAVHGNFGVNRGVNNTVAVIGEDRFGQKAKTEWERDEIRNAASVTVNAADKTTRTSIAGSGELNTNSTAVALGIGVALTDIGVKADNDTESEKARAEINNADITTVKRDGKAPVISAKTANTSSATTTAVGVGISKESWLGAQIVLADTETNKLTGAGLHDTRVDIPGAGGSEAANVAVTADSKSEVGAGAASVQVSGPDSVLTGIVAVGRNRVRDATTADVSYAHKPDEVSLNAGNLSIGASSSGSITSVAAGSSVAAKGITAIGGSGSYNLIENNVSALLNNANVKSKGNVGVVALSDDALTNYAGVVNVAAGGTGASAAIGVTVSGNTVSGKTEALISNSSVVAEGSSDEDKVIRTKSKLKDNTKEDKYLIDGAVTANTWKSGKLQTGRAEEKKTGVVVDSSATHSIASVMANGGVAVAMADSMLGGSLAGVVNLNYISGATTAKVLDSRINTEAVRSDVQVHAADYSNVAEMSGAAALGFSDKGAGTAGFTGTTNSVDRVTAAGISTSSAKWNGESKQYEISDTDKTKNLVYANNFAVIADAKQAMSGFNVTGSVAVATEGAIETGDNVNTNKMESSTVATVTNTTVRFRDAARVEALHEDRTYNLNVATGAAVAVNLPAGVAGSLNVGVGIVNEKSVVTANLENSKLEGTDPDKSSLSVKADNASRLATTLVSAGVAVNLFSAGIGTSVSVNSLDARVTSRIAGSELTAGTIASDTKNTVFIEDKIGTGGGAALVGIGVGVDSIAVNDTVSTVINNSTLKAKKRMTVGTGAERMVDGNVTGAGLGIGEVAVNVLSVTVNGGLQDTEEVQDDQGGTYNRGQTIQKVLDKVNTSVNRDLSQSFHGMSASEKKEMQDKIRAEARQKGAVQGTGVHTYVLDDSKLEVSDGDLSVVNREFNDGDLVGGSYGLGGLAVNVPDAAFRLNLQNDIFVKESDLTANSVNLSARHGNLKDTTDGIKAYTYQAGLSGVGIGTGNSSIITKGMTGVQAQSANLTARNGNLTLESLDTLKGRSKMIGVTAGLAVGIGVSVARFENLSANYITVTGESRLTAKKEDKNGKDTDKEAATLLLKAGRTGTVAAKSLGVGAGVGEWIVNKGHAVDKSTAIVSVTGGNNVFTADGLRFEATNAPVLKAESGGTEIGGVGIAVMKSEARAESGARVNIAEGNYLLGEEVLAQAVIGKEGQVMTHAETHGINGTLIGINPNTADAVTRTVASVDVGVETYKRVKAGGSDREEAVTGLSLVSQNNASRKTIVGNTTIGLALAIGIGDAKADGDDRSTVTAYGGAVKNLTVSASGKGRTDGFADGDSGGLFSFADPSAVTLNTTTHNLATLGGEWTVTERASVGSVQDTTSKGSARTGAGGVISVNWAKSDNNVTADTKTELYGATLKAGSSDVTAVNTVTTGAWENDKYNNHMNIGGLLNFAPDTKSTSVVKAEAGISIDGNSRVTTSQGQAYDAHNTLALSNQVEGKGGGGFENFGVHSVNNTTDTSKITVGKGSVLEQKGMPEEGGLTLSASDDLNLNSLAECWIVALEGAANTHVENNVDRTNEIKVDGTLSSTGDVNLSSGGGNLLMTTQAESHNNSVIPVRTGPFLSYNLKNVNAVQVDESGSVASYGDINIMADTGGETLRKHTVRVGWIALPSATEVSVLTNAPGKSDIVENNVNYVKVDGSLTAGNARKLDITITGSALPDTGGAFTPVAAQTPLAVKVDSTGLALTEKDIKTGNMDYATQLGAQLAAVNKLIEQYSAESKEDREKHLASYLGYVQQRQRIFEEMDKRGLYDWETVNGQRVKIYRTDGYAVRYVEIPEITASGGNITVQTNTLYGKGRLEANGAPRITVTNNSNAYLKLDGIRVGESGGAIRYRGSDITSNTKINEMNTGKGSEAAFSALRNDAASTTASAIIVTNDNKAGASVQMKDSAGKTVTYVPVTDVAVAGLVSNATGDVRISNTSGSIIIGSGTEDNEANVMGRTVQLIARDSVSQEFINGIVNIGGDPRVLNAAEVESAKNSAKSDVSAASDNHKSDYTKAQTNLNETLTDITRAELGRIAGDNIYISAADINVNGLIQSGYSKYEADIGEINLSNVAVKKNEATVQGRTMYKVNDGGKVRYDDSIGAFKYIVQVYYDPADKKLVVEDVDTKGGRIYLTGRISSTGNGRILAASGGADISVTNRTGLDMQAGKILNNNIEGKITITDLANDTWTEYTTSSTKTINHYSRFANDSAAAEKNTEIGNGIGFNNGATPNGVYKPKEGLRYNWSFGQKNGTNTEYHAVSKSPFWQNADSTSGQLRQLEASASEGAIGGDGDFELEQGAFIGELANDSNGKIAGTNFGGLYENKVTNDKRSNFRQWKENDEVWRFWASTDYHMTWNRSTGAAQSYTFSLKADRDIGVGFLGKENGGIALVSTRPDGGSINLAGDMKNNAPGAYLSVQTGGRISQKIGTSLTTGHAQLIAGDNIENIHITSLGSRTLNADGKTYTAADNVILYAESEHGGNVDVTAVGGTVEGQALPGNVTVRLLGSREGKEQMSGNVMLKADGNISTGRSGATVAGHRITLESVKGSIGDKDRPIQISGPDTAGTTDLAFAGVYAYAQKDINLQQDVNDMLVGSVISREGDVGLTVNQNGRLLDALPQTEGADNVPENELVRSWIDAGLIKGTDDYKGAYITRLEKDAAEYKARVEEQFALFTSGERVTDAIKEMFTKKDGSRYASADEFLKTDAQYQAIVEKYTHPTYTWTKEQLLYAIRNAIVNKESGEAAVTESKQANIQGKNVTLSAASIGKTSEGSTTILVKDLAGSSETAVSNLKKLASADAADVTMKDAAGNILYFATDNRGKQIVTARDAQGNTVSTDGRIYSFTIGHLNPVGVKATGRLDARAAKGELFIAGRSDEMGRFSPITVGNVKSDTEVRLYGRQGIYNAFSSTTSANISAKDLILYGGIKDIGARDKYLGVNLSGDLLTAAADGDVYIRNLTNRSRLRLGSLYAGNTLALDSYYGYLASNNPDYTTAYLNAGKQMILSADPVVGTVGSTLLNKPLRILNSGTPVSVEAESANILGVNGLRGDDAVLVLGDSNVTRDYTAVSNGSIKVTGNINAGNELSLETENGDIESAGNLKTREGDIILTSKAGAIDMTGDLDAGRDLTVKTGGYGILLLHDVDNEGNRVNIHAGRNITLQSEYTGIAVYGKVTADTGDISVSTKYTFIDYLGDVKAGGNVTSEMKESGDITYTGNVRAGKNITATILGGGNVSYIGNVTTDEKTGGDITALIDGYGDVAYKGTTSASGNISANVAGSGSITYAGDTRSGGNVSAHVEEAGTISFKGETSADGSIAGSVSEEGNVEFLGNVQAGSDVIGTTNKGDVLYAGNVESTFSSVTATANTGSIVYSGNVRAGADITGTVNEKGNVMYAGTTTAGNDVKAFTENGEIEYQGNVQAGSKVAAEAGAGWIWYEGNVSAGDNVVAYLENGNIVYANSVVAGGNVVALVDRGDIIYFGKVKAGHDVIANTSTGDILYGSDVTAGRRMSTRTGSGSVTFLGNVTAGKDLPEQIRLGYGKIAYFDRFGLVGFGNDYKGAPVRNAKSVEITVER